MWRKRYLLACILILCTLISTCCAAATESAAPSPAETPLKEILFGSSPLGWGDLDWEADLYYSNLSLNIPLTDRPILSTAETDEVKVYRQLFIESLVPGYLVLETAVMPLPLAGAGFRKYASHTYHELDTGGGQNIVKWVTAGFEEPYAVSLFLGEMIKFRKEGESELSSNKGYMGYMLSYSNQHIKNNILIPDHSLELEWKMKGEKRFKDDLLSWSFRLGTKLHSNQQISDTAYLGLMRSNLDFNASCLEFLRNSTIDFRWDFSLVDGRLLRQEYLVGKKFPVPSWHLAFKLDLGMIWEDQARYTGGLRDSGFQNFTVVFRPNIAF